MESGWTQLGGLGQLPASLSALLSCDVKVGTGSLCPIPLCTWTCGSGVSHWPGRSGTQKDGFNGQGSYLLGRDKVSERSVMPGKHLPQVRSSAVMVRTLHGFTGRSPQLNSGGGAGGVSSEDWDPWLGAAGSSPKLGSVPRGPCKDTDL